MEKMNISNGDNGAVEHPNTASDYTNLRPEYSKIEEQRRFLLVHPEDKYWILQDHCLTLPNSKPVFVYQSDERISYVNLQNEIFIWDWKNGLSHESDLNVDNKVSTLVELNSGDLIALSENRNVHVPNRTWNGPKNGSVVEIVGIGLSHFAVRYEDNSAALFSAEKDDEPITWYYQISRIWSIQDQFFFALKEKKSLLYGDINELEKTYEKKFSSELEYDDVINVSDTVCVCENDEVSIWERGTSWSTLKKEDFCSIWREHSSNIFKECCTKCSEFKDDINEKIDSAESSWENFIKSIKEKTVVFSSPGTFIFPQIPHAELVCVTYFSTIKTEPPAMFHVGGKTCIRHMILLSDGSVMYVTDNSRGSGIYVITKEEDVLTKYEKLTIDGEVSSLKEMIDDSVATLCFQSSTLEHQIWIITPRISPSHKLDDRIKYLQSQSTINSNNSSLCDKWPNKFSFDHAAYQTYLDGIARKFYERAKHIISDRDKLMGLFLYYLTRFPRNKMERKIQVGLFELFEYKKCKKRLFIGEGDFTFTESMIKTHIHTHKQLPKSIVATELKDKLDEKNERIKLLKDKGVRIIPKVDGTKIHEHPDLKDEKFERVQWNFPFSEDPTPGGREVFREVIPKFFESCEKIQLTGDRIHISLMNGWRDCGWHERRQYENPIAEGSVKAGYRLIRKRRFEKERYPNYVQKSTAGIPINVPGFRREFIFEKVSKSDYNEDVIKENIKNSLPIGENAQKKYFIKVNRKTYDSLTDIPLRDCYIECSTDDDSSDYYSD